MQHHGETLLANLNQVMWKGMRTCTGITVIRILYLQRHLQCEQQACVSLHSSTRIFAAGAGIVTPHDLAFVAQLIKKQDW